MTELHVPNHHADHPGFSGPAGLLAALSMAGGRRATFELAADLSQLTTGDRVVDVGCGPGASARTALRRGAATYVGVDPAPVMLRVARAVVRDARVRWEEGTAEATGLERESADVVWALATAHHWHDVGRGGGEVRRILAPSGRFVALERATRTGATGHASHGWTGEQADAFARACLDAGFATAVVSRHPTRRGDTHAVVARS